jgi:hypothetical protein
MLNGTSLRKFIAPSPVLSFADETLGAQGNPEIPLSSPFEKREKEGDLTLGAFASLQEVSFSEIARNHFRF